LETLGEEGEEDDLRIDEDLETPVSHLEEKHTTAIPVY
jgi:hypothetical protein